MITSKEIVISIEQALKEFGEYQYKDKGAREVMDIEAIADRLKEMPIPAIIKVLEEVEASDVNAGAFLTDCCYSFDNWDNPKVDELFESNIFQEWY